MSDEKKITDEIAPEMGHPSVTREAENPMSSNTQADAAATLPAAPHTTDDKAVWYSVFAIIASVIALVSALVGGAQSKETDTVAVVDYAVVLSSHPNWQKADDEAQATFATITEEAKKVQADATLSPQEKAERLRALQQEMEVKEKNLYKPIKDAIDHKIDVVMKEKGYTKVFDKQAFVRGSGDITRDVLEREGLDKDTIDKILAKAREVAPSSLAE